MHRQILLPLAGLAIPAYTLLLLPTHILLRALKFQTLAAALSAYSRATARCVRVCVFWAVDLYGLLYGETASLSACLAGFDRQTHTPPPHNKRLVPLGINLALRFIFYTPLDQAYLAVLSDLNPTLAQQLGRSPARSYKEVLWKEARRLVRLISFLPLYVGLSLIPVFGRVLKWGFKVWGSLG